MIDKSEPINPIDELAEEFTERLRDGEKPTIAEYADSHPELADEIRQLFPSIIAMERLKHRKVSSGEGHIELKVRHLERLGDYRIIREIGRGGMGIVYEAEQESLGRNVAVKVLPEQSLLNEKHLNRFQREAQTAAKLNHTNIVPIYGVGEEDGLPYIVMQHIRGVALDEVLREVRRGSKSPDDSTSVNVLGGAETEEFEKGSSQHLSTSQAVAALFGGISSPSQSGVEPIAPTVLDEKEPPNSEELAAALDQKRDASEGCKIKNRGMQGRGYWQGVARIGVQVSEALAYAHSQDTLHRDIKPANLLVDENGTVCITDFGLAKVMSQDSMSRSGDVVGTLRYMAPEQFNGQADERSDIHSLGLTLFELATLRPAFEEVDVNQLVLRVTQSDPPRPRSINSNIPRDLETIILKAIARESHLRYETAQELADDLQRFLEDRPIRARRASVSERIWRWSRRNPAVASLSVLLASVVVAAFCLLAWEWRKTETALSTAQAERNKAASETDRAELERDRAEKENERAEKNLSMALESMDEVFDRLASNWMAHPTDIDIPDDGQTPEFQLVANSETAVILQDALKFYDRFAEQNATNPRLRYEGARANRRIGEIHQRLGQPTKAADAYRAAVEIYGQLVDEFPNENNYAIDQGATCNELATVLRSIFEFEEAEQSLQQAKALLKSDSSKSVVAKFELAKTYTMLGNMFFKFGSRKPAENHRQSAVETLNELVQNEPSNAQYRLAQSRAYRNLYPMFSFSNRRSEAKEARAKSLAILEQLVTDFPNTPDYRCELAEMLSMTTTWGRDEPQRKEVEDAIRRSIQLSADLAIQFPTIPRYRAALASANQRLSSHLRRSDDKKDAEKLQSEAVVLYTALADEFDSVPSYRMFLASAHSSLANLYQSDKKLEDARKEYESAIQNQTSYLETRPESHYGKSMLARHYQDLARTLKNLKLDEESAKATQKSKDLWTEIHRDNPMWRKSQSGKWSWPKPSRGINRKKEFPQFPRKSASPPL